MTNNWVIFNKLLPNGLQQLAWVSGYLWGVTGSNSRAQPQHRLLKQLRRLLQNLLASSALSLVKPVMPKVSLNQLEAEAKALGIAVELFGCQ
ncbi:hypothetical protein OK016_10885 [Vibrio chagasii]|nr:hypothetical protein [Vibrio chagasii]